MVSIFDRLCCLDCFLLVFIFFHLAFAQQGQWIYPDPNTFPFFNGIDTVNASWTLPGNFVSPYLILWCTASISDSGYRGALSGALDNGLSNRLCSTEHNVSVSSTGSQLVPLIYGGGPGICHFNIVHISPSGYKTGFNSGLFNISGISNAEPVTWGLISTSSTSATSISGPFTIQSTTTSKNLSLPSASSIPPSTVSISSLSPIQTLISTGVTAPDSSNTSAAPSPSTTPPSPPASSFHSNSYPSTAAVAGISVTASLTGTLVIFSIRSYIRARRRTKCLKEPVTAQSEHPPSAGSHLKSGLCPRELAGSQARSAELASHPDRELFGYPIAMTGLYPVEELEGLRVQ
ncbi:hypothetical protein MMC28_001089 [Mycoblastus sanguinarius]|nr:hypothetical protein [Mycoblastus sanguinarius]